MSFAAIPSSPVAVSLRVADVRGAAAFYQQIGFRYVMAVPDENDEWLFCLLRFGNGSILLGALDHPRFPRSGRQRGVPSNVRAPGARVDLDVPDLAAPYTACIAAGCQIIAEPTQAAGGGGARSFRWLDPFGYEWQLTEAAVRLEVRQARESHEDRVALACQCATIAALI
jgi:catechol 2,3-dioxygenase-like lactoylglutathione lyase family enzyme